MRLKNAEKTRLAGPAGDVVSTLVQRVLIIWTGGDKFKKDGGGNFLRAMSVAWPLPRNRVNPDIYERGHRHLSSPRAGDAAPLIRIHASSDMRIKNLA